MASQDDSFGGRAGDVVSRAVSPAALITGLLMAATAGGAGFLCMKAGLRAIAPAVAAFIVAGFLARAAVDAYDARWSAGRGVPFGDFVPVALRYLAMQAVLVLPLIFVGWKPELAGALLFARAAEGGSAFSALLVFGLYLACIVIAPPVLLIVAVGAESFADVASPSHWGRSFASRGADLFLIYVLYAGAMLCVLVICLPLMAIVAVAAPKVLAFTAALAALFATGTAILLLGQLCGEFARALRPADPKMKIIAQAPPASGPTIVQPTPSSKPRAPSPDVSSATIPISIAPVAAAIPAPATSRPTPPAASAPRKLLPLLDAPKRVEQIMSSSGGNLAQAAAPLEQLRTGFAPNGTVLHALAIVYARSGRRDDAVAVAREAIPLCAKSGSIVLAAEIVATLRDSLGAIGVTEEQAIGFAESLRTAKRYAPASALYSTLLKGRPVNSRAMKGALQAAQDLVAAGNAKASLTLFDQLTECAAGTPLADFVRDGREAAMKKASTSA